MRTMQYAILVWFAAVPLTYTVVAQDQLHKSDRAAATGQSAHTINVPDKDGKSLQLGYWLFFPQDYRPRQQSPDKAWPLMIFLHGRGESGDDLNLVKTWGPPKLVADQPDFPFVLISPQCPIPQGPVRSGWDIVAVKNLIDHAIAKHNVDPERIYLTDLSMGGFGSWRLAAAHPNFFAAVIPICGGGDLTTADRLTAVPIWAFHGETDRVVPVAASKKMVEAIQAAGGTHVKLTVYPDVGHNSWSTTYANPEIYKWLLDQRRNRH